MARENFEKTVVKPMRPIAKAAPHLGCLLGLVPFFCCMDACTLSTSVVPGDIFDGIEDLLANAEPITTFDGEWLSPEFLFAVKITDRIGVVTLPNSDVLDVGDVLMVITSAEPDKFDARQIFKDGSVQEVIGILQDPDTIAMFGAGLTWSMVRINTPNAPPMVDAGPDQSATLDEGPVTLDGTVADDGVSGDVLTLIWRQLNGPDGATIADRDVEDTTVTFIQNGIYVFQLDVSDGDLNTTSNVTITVNALPVADAGDDQSVEPGDLVTLDGEASSDPDGEPFTFAWTQTIGAPVDLDDSTVSDPTFAAPDEPTTLVFQLTVTDEFGASSTDTITVSVGEDGGNPRVRLLTTMGEIILEILLQETPIASRNFLQYVEDGFYDGTIFHRVSPNFVVQGGGFLPGMIPQDGLREPIVNEFSPDRSNLRGTVATAKIGDDPDSATSQFFFNLADNSENLDNQNGGFTVFARVLEGLDVVDAMSEVELNGEMPITDIVLTSATLD